MTKTFASFASFSLAFSLFACGSGGEPAQNSGAGGSTAGTSGARGGSANATGGATTASSGGSTASAGGNTNGTQGGSSSTSMGGASNGSGGSSAGGSGSAQGGATSGGVGGASASGGQSQSGGAAQGGGTASGGGMATGGDEPKLITSNEKSFWQTATPTEVTSGTADVTVNDTAAQTFTGFGGAFNEMSWDALSVLSEADRTRALKLLFDAQDGANFIYGRIPIGANDYSTIADGPYTLADTANDTAMANFSIARDQKRIIPFIKAAKAV
ncbi:MAG TPA: hypothetical protein VFQ35_00585, partial [Polyangiaceae bacterium]|nr:hypothetical protein [Polyangiaceae bacterium]